MLKFTHFTYIIVIVLFLHRYSSHSKQNGVGSAEYLHAIGVSTLISSDTNDSVQGEFNIKKFDSTNLIVAGTFWFNAISNVSDTVKITNGRFDMTFQ